MISYVKNAAECPYTKGGSCFLDFGGSAILMEKTCAPILVL